MSTFGFFAKVQLRGHVAQPPGRARMTVMDDLPRLTAVQVRVIRQLIQHGVTPQNSFAPLELWPGHSREEYENRLACQELMGMGLIDLKSVATMSPCEARKYVLVNGEQYRLRLMGVAIEALDAFDYGGGNG